MADYKDVNQDLMHQDIRVTDGTYAPLLGSDVQPRIGRLAMPDQSADGLSQEVLAAMLRRTAEALAA